MSKKNLTVKQRKLIEQIPAIVSGQRTESDAMRIAGYAESTVGQHSEVIGNDRVQAAMQTALRAAGFDELFIADKLLKGAKTLPPGREQLGYLEKGAELLDAVPAKKTDATMKLSGSIELTKLYDAAAGRPTLSVLSEIATPLDREELPVDPSASKAGS